MVIRSFIISILFLLLNLIQELKAQDPQFSQVFALPIHLNSAFTGNTGKDRLAISHRRQWLGIGQGYVSYAASFDTDLRKKGFGVGGSILHDRAGISGLGFTEFSSVLSKEVPLGPKSGMVMGMKLGRSVQTIDREQLLFWDEIYSGSEGSSSSSGIEENLGYFEAGSGILYYTNHFWGGVNVDHINRPKRSFSGSEHRLPMRFSVHVGAEIALKKRRDQYSALSLMPVVIYKAQGNWSQMDLGGYFEKSRMRFGMWYRGFPIEKRNAQDFRNSDALVFLIGAEISENLQLGYSYDYTISQLGISSGGSHELSMVYVWPRKHDRYGRKSAIPCPRF